MPALLSARCRKARRGGVVGGWVGWLAGRLVVLHREGTARGQLGGRRLGSCRSAGLGCMEPRSSSRARRRSARRRQFCAGCTFSSLHHWAQARRSVTICWVLNRDLREAHREAAGLTRHAFMPRVMHARTLQQSISVMMAAGSLAACCICTRPSTRSTLQASIKPGSKPRRLRSSIATPCHPPFHSSHSRLLLHARSSSEASLSLVDHETAAWATGHRRYTRLCSLATSPRSVWPCSSSLAR